MKKEFLYLLGFAFIVCFSLDGSSVQVFQAEGKAKSGSSVFFWNANGSEKFCDSMKKNLVETMQTGKEERFTVPSPEGQKNPVIQICQDGRLLVNPTEKLEYFVIRDPHGKIIINTKKNKGQLDSGLLDEGFEEDIKRRVEKLQVGESITAVFFDDSKLCVTFDQIITLVSKIDGSNHPARWSQVRSLISGAIFHDCKEKSENKIELGLTGKEIVMLFNVAALGKKERRKLLSGLTIFDHIVLVANIHMHYFSKKFFSVCRSDLIKRVRDALKKGDVSWFKKVSSLENDRGNNIQAFIENLLKRIIGPVPKVLLEKEGVSEVEFDGTRAVVCYQNGRVEIIIEIENEKRIFTRDNIINMEVTADGTRAIVEYLGDDNRIERIDIESGDSIFTRNNVFRADRTRAMVKYIDYRDKIIEIESGNSIFTRNNVKSMKATADGSKVIVLCNDNKLKILDLEDYDRGIDFVKFNPKQLLFAFNLSQDPDYLDHVQDKNNAKKIWQSFEPEVQEKLKKSYFPAIDFQLSYSQLCGKKVCTIL